jgi:hypothetical protein
MMDPVGVLLHEVRFQIALSYTTTSKRIGH